MESAFSWLGKLAGWLGKLIPKIGICRATHGGVKFVRGKNVKEVKPGLYLYWPLTTEVVIVPVARQTLNLVSQVLVTKDGKSVTAGAVVVYKISNVVDALSKNWDVDHSIGDITQSAIVETITKLTLSELMVNARVVKELTARVSKELTEFGLDVMKCVLTDFSPCFVLKFLGDKQ